MTTHIARPARLPRLAKTARLAAILVAAAMPALVACSGKTKKPATTVTTTPAPARPRPPAARTAEPQTATVTPQGGGSEAMPSFAPIRFDFDSAALSVAAREELQQLADWMARNGAARVMIEGHADERGTTEYNLALGQQRAEAIAAFLSRLGIDTARLQTISYGEERPAVDGSDDAAWAANRRGELEPRR